MNRFLRSLVFAFPSNLWTCSECPRSCWVVSTAKSIPVELEILCACVREMEDPLVTVKEVEEEWQLVRPRKGKPHTKRLSHRSAEDGHLSCCPGHGPNSNLSSRDADEEQRLRAKLQKSLERVRTSVFFKKLVEQMQCLQIFEKLLANARRAARLNRDHSVVKGDFAAVPSLGPNSVEHEACTFHFSDGTCAALPMTIIFRVYGFRVEGLLAEKLHDP